MANQILKRETLSEPRGCSRFIPREQAFVALSELGRLGPITDISVGGVGCEFILSFGEKGAITGDIAPTLSADIIGSDHSFFLKNVPCHIAYDIIASEDRSEYIRSITKRRCGLKFGQLTEEQKEQVNLFLENNTFGTA